MDTIRDVLTSTRMSERLRRKETSLQIYLTFQITMAFLANKV